MPRKRFTAEQIISKLREADVLLGQGMAIGQSRASAWGDRQDLLPLAQRVWWS